MNPLVVLLCKFLQFTLVDSAFPSQFTSLALLLCLALPNYSFLLEMHGTLLISGTAVKNTMVYQ